MSSIDPRSRERHERYLRYRRIAKELTDKTAGYPPSHLEFSIRTRAEVMAVEDVKPYVTLAKRLGHTWMDYDSGNIVGYIQNALQRIHERELRAMAEAIQIDR